MCLGVYRAPERPCPTAAEHYSAPSVRCREPPFTQHPSHMPLERFLQSPEAQGSNSSAGNDIHFLFSPDTQYQSTWILKNTEKKITDKCFDSAQVAAKERKSQMAMPAWRVTHGSTVHCPACVQLSWCSQAGPGATGSSWFVRARLGRASTSSPSTFRAKPRWDDKREEKCYVLMSLNELKESVLYTCRSEVQLLFLVFACVLIVLFCLYIQFSL